MWLAICVSLSCCGSSDKSASQPGYELQTGFLVSAPGERIAVAEVGGVPIYEQCVAIQAQAHKLDRRAALDECIAFEVLAQAAQKRGLHLDPDVDAIRRTESVRQLLHHEIVAPMPSVEATDRSILEDAYREFRDRIYAPERREIFHLYAPFPKHREPRGTEGDAAAKKRAEELYAQLSQWRDLTPDEMLFIAQGIAGDEPLGPIDDKTDTFRREVFKVYLDQPNMPREFSHAAFDIPEVGMVSVPTRSDYGWHIILYLSRDPARMANVDEAAQWLFQAVRFQRYRAFSGELGKDVDVEIDEQALSRLQEREDRLRFPSAGTP